MIARPFGLSQEQLRVLGALTEKAATTPDIYPLTSNALRTACNQRSSRDPVVDYDEDTVKSALLTLRERGLAKTIRGAGSRVFKHAHTLDVALELDAARIAVLSVLALRGPQTVGEIKTRTERQHQFSSLDDVEEALRLLASLDEPLIEQLEREPGKKEPRWQHRLDIDPLAAAPTRPTSEESPPSPHSERHIADPEAGTQSPPDPPARPLPPLLTQESDARAATLEEITARIQRLEQTLEEIKQRLDAS
jgi:uncharacterized protein YceH (UPF0502 family)